MEWECVAQGMAHQLNPAAEDVVDPYDIFVHIGWKGRLHYKIVVCCIRTRDHSGAHQEHGIRVYRDWRELCCRGMVRRIFERTT